MRINSWAFGVAAIVSVLFQEHGMALDADVTDADIQRAVSVAAGPKDARARFHKPYALPITDSTVERIEVLTEFRRFVLASEEQATLGNWMVARGGYDAKGRTLKQLVGMWRGIVTIRTALRFHPQHRYSTVPAIDILVGEPTFVAKDVVRTPVLALAADGKPAPMTGAVIETLYDAHLFGERTLPVRIVFEGKEIARVAAEFSRLE